MEAETTRARIELAQNGASVIIVVDEVSEVETSMLCAGGGVSSSISTDLSFSSNMEWRRAISAVFSAILVGLSVRFFFNRVLRKFLARFAQTVDSELWSLSDSRNISQEPGSVVRFFSSRVFSRR